MDNQEPRKKVERVVTGRARTRRRRKIDSLAENFISNEAGDIKTHVFSEIVFPTIVNMIRNIAHDCIEMLLPGTGSSSEYRRYGRESRSSNISYNKYYDDRERSSRTSRNSQRETVNYEYEDPLVDTRGEAELVLTRMEDIMEAFRTVTVLDLYDACGIRTNPGDHKYGWTSLKGARIVRLGSEYLIKMPRPMPIDE